MQLKKKEEKLSYRELAGQLPVGEGGIKNVTAAEDPPQHSREALDSALKHLEWCTTAARWAGRPCTVTFGCAREATHCNEFLTQPRVYKGICAEHLDLAVRYKKGETLALRDEKNGGTVYVKGPLPTKSLQDEYDAERAYNEGPIVPIDSMPISAQLTPMTVALKLQAERDSERAYNKTLEKNIARLEAALKERDEMAEAAPRTTKRRFRLERIPKTAVAKAEYERLNALYGTRDYPYPERAIEIEVEKNQRVYVFVTYGDMHIDDTNLPPNVATIDVNVGVEVEAFELLPAEPLDFVYGKKE